ncbi:hypothetical protein P171DRAFT_432095 [Karstenula rhodostoma CBS 690.94]|uniref:Uncharacterized protein n=1 Tax=Karstenula rhodostoma CBS 690.94 TaxID=1392251 RepID=A0A9P4UC60_9PLEO|nr:hypothetical protein P171DRAFT_432095 [Karstenula rhodostoma CBS 690.94]
MPACHSLPDALLAPGSWLLSQRSATGLKAFAHEPLNTWSKRADGVRAAANCARRRLCRLFFWSPLHQHGPLL